MNNFIELSLDEISEINGGNGWITGTVGAIGAVGGACAGLVAGLGVGHAL